VFAAWLNHVDAKGINSLAARAQAQGWSLAGFERFPEWSFCRDLARGEIVPRRYES
jgi:hypothetical protein